MNMMMSRGLPQLEPATEYWTVSPSGHVVTMQLRSDTHGRYAYVAHVAPNGECTYSRRGFLLDVAQRMARQWLDEHDFERNLEWNTRPAAETPVYVEPYAEWLANGCQTI